MYKCSSCCRGNDVNPESSGVNLTLSTSSTKCLREDSHTIFYCCGPPTRSGAFWTRHGMSKSAEEEYENLELGLEADENAFFEGTKIFNPRVPYTDKLPVDLHLGSAIEILGKTWTNCNRFTINLSTGQSNDSDIALHFNPRFDRRIIVRNHRIAGKWGVEEIASVQPFPFKLGKSFSVLIFIADEQFMVTVNKVHFCAFTFRIAMKNITHVIITGDIILHFIHFTTRESYPPQIFSKTPYVVVPRTYDKLQNKCDIRRKVSVIQAGTKIEIYGRMKLLPRGFYVNLQQGLDLWPHPLIPFHMNLRIHPPGTSKREQELIFNSWLKGGWEKESVIGFSPFMPGTEFYMTIDCSPACFLVEVNDKFLYKHKRLDTVNIDSILIYGDVIISKVILRRMSASSYGKRRSLQVN